MNIVLRKIFSFNLILLALVSLSAQGESGAYSASDNYEISPLDYLKFRVIGEEETLSEIRVSADGKVSLPFVHDVKIAGKTVEEARQLLYDIYNRDYYVNPQIELVIVAYKQRRVMVQGMVNNQGFVVFPSEENMTLLGAISEAGGWSNSRLAAMERVKLRRTLKNGETQETVIDVTEIGANDWPLEDGDVVFVPERRF